MVFLGADMEFHGFLGCYTGFLGGYMDFLGDNMKSCGNMVSLGFIGFIDRYMITY